MDQFRKLSSLFHPFPRGSLVEELLSQGRFIDIGPVQKQLVRIQNLGRRFRRPRANFPDFFDPFPWCFRHKFENITRAHRTLAAICGQQRHDARIARQQARVRELVVRELPFRFGGLVGIRGAILVVDAKRPPETQNVVDEKRGLELQRVVLVVSTAWAYTGFCP